MQDIAFRVAGQYPQLKMAGALDLPNAGVGPGALIEGVRPAQPPEMPRRLIDRATAVLPF